MKQMFYLHNTVTNYRSLGMYTVLGDKPASMSSKLEQFRVKRSKVETFFCFAPLIAQIWRLKFKDRNKMSTIVKCHDNNN